MEAVNELINIINTLLLPSLDDLHEIADDAAMRVSAIDVSVAADAEAQLKAVAATCSHDITKFSLACTGGQLDAVVVSPTAQRVQQRLIELLAVSKACMAPLRILALRKSLCKQIHDTLAAVHALCDGIRQIAACIDESAETRESVSAHLTGRVWKRLEALEAFSVNANIGTASHITLCTKVLKDAVAEVQQMEDRGVAVSDNVEASADEVDAQEGDDAWFDEMDADIMLNAQDFPLLSPLRMLLKCQMVLMQRVAKLLHGGGGGALRSARLYAALEDIYAAATNVNILTDDLVALLESPIDRLGFLAHVSLIEESVKQWCEWTRMFAEVSEESEKESEKRSEKGSEREESQRLLQWIELMRERVEETVRTIKSL